MKHNALKQAYPGAFSDYRLKFPLFILLGLLLALSLSCAGTDRLSSMAESRSEEIPLMANARTGLLSSGMRYYLLDNAMPEGRALLTLVVDAGSILETEEERGLAHFLEHMAFNGTTRFPKNDLLNYLRSLGMRFGPEVNARTSFDYTIYDLEVPTERGSNGERRIPERALAIIDDWTWALTFDLEEFENERLVLIEEYRFRMGANERVNRQIYPVLFRDSLYSERLPIGLLSVLETAPIERLINYYERWYRPENMAIIIVGDFDVDLLETELELHFPVHREQDNYFTRPRHDLRQPEPGSLQTITVTDHELTDSYVELYWQRLPLPRNMDMAAFREDLIDNLIDTMLSIRFQEEAVKLQTPYAWAGAGTFGFAAQSRFYYIVAQSREGEIEGTLSELLLTKESLIRYGFVEEELNEAKSSILSYLDRMVAEEGRHQSSRYIRAFTQHFLDNIAAPGFSWELETTRALLPGINLEEINSVVRSYFAEDDLTIIITAPDSELSSIPSDAQIRTIAAESRYAQIAAPVRSTLSENLLDYIPRPGSIVSESIDSETGATRWALSNGAEVILRESRNTNNQITLYALAQGGSYSYGSTGIVPNAAAASADMAAAMLGASGLGSFTRTELTRFLQDKQASLSFWSQPFLRGFQGSATVQDAETLFELLYLNFVHTRLDAEPIEVMLSQQRTSLSNMENDPTSAFLREFSRVAAGNPRFHPSATEDLDLVNIDEALRFITMSLNPADYTFVFVGNMDIQMMRPLIENYIASIPRGNQNFNRWAETDPLRPSRVERNFFRGSDERSMVNLSWYSPYPFSEEAHAAASILDAYLEIALNDAIRESLGGVYAIGSSFVVTPVSRPELSGIVRFICDPNRAEELLDAVILELQNIASGDINNVIFAQALEAVLQGHDELVQRDNLIAQSYANSVRIFNSPLSRQDNRPNYYRAVTVRDVQEMMRLLLGGNYIRMILYPEQGHGG